jgi:pilus assembly protein CpaF
VRDISLRVRERLRAEQIEPARHPDRAAGLALDEVRRHNDYALARGGDVVDDEAACVRDVMATVSGYGALQPLLDDPAVEEIWINAPDRVFCARGGRNERVRLTLTAEAVRDLVERMLHATGRRVDLSHPFVDASLPDGSRLHVVIPDITREHWSVNIRKFLPHRRSLDDLVVGGAMPSQVATLLRGVMMEGSNVLVSGATHAGKTTLLGALLAACPESERIVTVEETFELALPSSDVVALQGRQPSLEGTGEVTLRRLVKEALRMRPDRLVVGEVRDAEALDLLLALNTGVPGAATIHANSAGEAVRKLASLALLAGRSIDTAFVLPAVASAVHVVVHCTRTADGRRVVSEIARTTGEIVEGTVRTHSCTGRGRHDRGVRCRARGRNTARTCTLAVARRSLRGADRRRRLHYAASSGRSRIRPCARGSADLRQPRSGSPCGGDGVACHGAGGGRAGRCGFRHGVSRRVAQQSRSEAAAAAPRAVARRLRAARGICPCGDGAPGGRLVARRVWAAAPPSGVPSVLGGHGGFGALRLRSAPSEGRAG